MNDYKKYLSFAQKVILQVRDLSLPFIGKTLENKLKDDNTLLTNVDLEIENFIRNKIIHEFPDHDIVGEELSNNNNQKDYKWIIDPIDGTLSFFHGIPLFGTIISLLYKNKPVVGLVDLPAINLSFCAGTNLGASVNGVVIKIPDKKEFSMDHEIIIFGERLQFVDANESSFFDYFLSKYPRLRIYPDCFGHMMVAQSSAAAMVDFNLNIWDYAATEVIIKEAGGVFRKLKNNSANIADSKNNIIFGQPSVVNWILETYREFNIKYN